MTTQIKTNRQTNCGTKSAWLRLTLSAIVLTLFCATVARAQVTAFTYQGKLSNSNGPISGSYDLHFAVFDAPGNGNQLGGTLTNLATWVTNGLFTVTLDFGPEIFTGAERWLEIGVKTTGLDDLATLSPRQ